MAMTVKEAREALAIDQNEMARLCGVSKMVYCRWEWHNQPGRAKESQRKPPAVAIRYIELMLWLDSQYPSIMDKWIEQQKVLSKPY